MQAEEKEKKVWRKMKSLREIWESIRYTNITIMRVSEAEKKEQKIF